MAKKKCKARDKVSWSNPKVSTVVSYLQLGENRITKAELMSLGTKDIFYQLRNSGYIRESSNGTFAGTEKLHRHIKKMDGSHFSSSGSAFHSQKLRDSLSLLPSSVLERKAFKTSFDIEAAFNKKTLKSQDYRETLQTMKSEIRTNLHSTEVSFKMNLSRCTDDIEEYQLKLGYLRQRTELESKLSYLEDKPFLVPDYCVTLSMSERLQYIENLEGYRATLNESSKAYSLFTESIDKLRGMPEGTVTVNVEIATSNYGNRELYLHQCFEQLSGTPQIILM